MIGLHKTDNGLWKYDRWVTLRNGDKRRIQGTIIASRQGEAEAELVRVLLMQDYALRSDEHTYREATERYLEECRAKRSWTRIKQSVDRLLPWIGNLRLQEIHQAALAPFIAHCKEQGEKSATVERDIRGAVTPILNRAARVWREGGRPWLETAVPLIESVRWNDARKPHPLTWEEQDRLFGALPEYLRQVCRFLVWTGCRAQEALHLRWDWEQEVPELGTSVFVIPAKYVKNKDDRLVVLGKEAAQVVSEQWGKHKTLVFPSSRGQGKIAQMSNRTWYRVIRELGMDVHVHDLKHTFGHRLRAAGIPVETRKTLLGHKNTDITVHYSAPDIKGLLDAINVVTREQKTVLRVGLLREGVKKSFRERDLQQNRAD